MTIQDETRTASFAGSGTSGPFTFDFRIINSDEITVVHVSATGVETVLTETTQYTCTLVDLGLSGGSVTTTFNIETGEDLYIIGNTPATQLTRFSNQGAFYAETHEESFDRTAMVARELKELLNRVPRFKYSTTAGVMTFPEPVAYGILGYNADGDDLEVYTPGDLSILTAFYQDGSGNVSFDNGSAVTSGINFDINGIVGIKAGSEATPSLANRTDTDTGLFFGISLIGFAVSGKKHFQIAEPSVGANTVNYVQVRGATTTNSVDISAQGSDSNVGLILASKGTGAMRFLTGGISGVLGLYLNHTANGVNYILMAAGTAGNAPAIGGIGDGGLTLYTSDASAAISLKTNNASVTNLTCAANGNVAVGSAELLTSATGGFLWIPSCAGTATGSATAPYTNAAALVYDSTNNKIMVRCGGTWRSTAALT